MNATRASRVERFQSGSFRDARTARGHSSSRAAVAPGPGPGICALEMNGVLAIDPDGRALRLVCDHGQVWITQAGDPRDVLLSPGATFTSASTGKIVVQALAPSRFLVSRI